MTMHSFAELSEDDLDRMESRIDAATVGPWLSNNADADLTEHTGVIELGLCNELGTFKSIELVGANEADQDFIVNARQDMPRLLREVRFLRARLQSIGTSKSDRESHSKKKAASDALHLAPSM